MAVPRLPEGLAPEGFALSDYQSRAYLSWGISHLC
jgi:hypothetical protein